MSGNHSEFKHENLTEYEADFLVGSYKKRGMSAKKSLSKTSPCWEVSVLLEEDYINRSSRLKSPNVWGHGHVVRIHGERHRGR